MRLFHERRITLGTIGSSNRVSSYVKEAEWMRVERRLDAVT